MTAQERFEQIYRAHHAAVSAYARRRARPDLAEEVVAETFLVCWRRLDAVPDEPLPWLYAVARKTLANARRAAERRPEAAGTLDVAAAEQLRDRVLAQALRQLSEHDRELLLLVAWEGLSLGEAATVLGCAPVACRVRFLRAKRRLAARLAELDPDAPLPRPRPEGATR
jgi:RNA polymerase sigma-70 factor (ECF subfamily)